MVLRLVVFHVFLLKKSDKDLNIKKESGGDMVIETNEHLINVSFNRDISLYLKSRFYIKSIL